MSRDMITRRRQRIAQRRRDRALNRPKEVEVPDTEEFPCIPFPLEKSEKILRADVYESQGTRDYMEDMHHYVISRDHCFFGVYDGHGGKSVPKYVKKHLYEELKNYIYNEKYDETPENAIRDCFLDLEDKLYTYSRRKYEKKPEKNQEEEKEGENENEKKKEEEEEPYEPISGGSCTSILWILDDLTCLTGNIGDCKMVLYKKTGEFKVLTRDHDTNNPNEIQRMEDLGIKVKIGTRVGGLKITRSFGDFFRPKGKKVICADPFITKFKLDIKTDHSIVIASDGLWENINEQEVFEEIRPEVDPRISTRKLMKRIVTKVRDNITICVIHFHEQVSDETKKKAERLKKFMTRRYSNDDVIKKAIKYRKQREENPDSPTAYKLMWENAKKNDGGDGRKTIKIDDGIESSSSEEDSEEEDDDDSSSDSSSDTDNDDEEVKEVKESVDEEKGCEKDEEEKEKIGDKEEEKSEKQEKEEVEKKEEKEEVVEDEENEKEEELVEEKEEIEEVKNE